MGRKAYQPTDELRAAVRTRSGLGMPHEAIARYLRIDDKTMYKYYREELDRGVDEANAQVAGAIFNAATGRQIQPDGSVKRVDPNPTLAIWWSKVRMGWRDPATEKGEVHAALAIVNSNGNGRVDVKLFIPEERTLTDETGPVIDGEAEEQAA